MPPSKPNSLALTCGAGISVEITQKAWTALRTQKDFTFFVVGCPDDYPESRTITQPDEAASCFAEALPVLPLQGGGDRSSSGEPARALASLEQATDLVLPPSGGGTTPRARALVTNPINKAHLAGVGFTHKGQTEFLTARANLDEDQTLMMLATKNLRCALITTHLPLREVAAALTTAKIISKGKILYQELQTRFGIAAPHIAMAALNPHAGDDGLLGTEEKDIIQPASTALGKNFTAPLPADSMFARTGFDAFLCIYHDQALIPIKLQTTPAVNITLGLPFVRTSPDHGTAFEIVGRGLANPDSLIAALRQAHDLTA